MNESEAPEVRPRPVLPAEPYITPEEMRKIWASVRSLSWSREQLYRLVEELSGKTSLRTLTREEASRVIDRLVASGAEPTIAPRPKRARAVPLAENVVEMLTDRQVGMIKRLSHHLGWSVEHPDFRAWLRERIGSDLVRTKREGIRVINLLRARIRDAGIEGTVAESHRRHYPPAPSRDREPPRQGEREEAPGAACSEGPA